MDENVVEQIKTHQETIAAESNSPLQLIREKELEISGRMLTAKRSADTVVADARRRAAEVVAKAESEGGAGAQDRVKAIEARAVAQASELAAAAEAEVQSINERIDSHRDDAVRLVLDVVTAV